MTASIVWFRNDLRLADNPALTAAIRRGGAVIPIFIWAPEEESPWEPGAASRWWLHHSLAALDESLRKIGSRLIIARGPSLEALRTAVQRTTAAAIFWNKRYEPAVIERDTGIKDALHADGLIVESFDAALLHDPRSIQTQNRKPFQVFTPFWRKCLTVLDPPKPLPSPRRLPPPAQWPRAEPLAALHLLPRLNWADEFSTIWEPGETGARRRLKRFVSGSSKDYLARRNSPGVEGTSRLSPHLHFGELSPRQVWHGVAQRAVKHGTAKVTWASSQFVTELGWREFAHHLLFHFPHSPSAPLRNDFHSFPWREDKVQLKAWQQGRTGFPIVDAGMRQLWRTGWMHNRVRMIVASFLIKDLLIDWRQGARWFWDTLVDADLAQNTLGWQWTAGCGADAAPFFRIFNPTTQGIKFDSEGDYVRQWCPELRKLPAKWIHQPHLAPSEILANAGVRLGTDYPEPIVNHAMARNAALDALAEMKKSIKRLTR